LSCYYSWEQTVEKGKFRIILADDHALFREAVRAVLDADAEFDVVAEASSGAEVLSALDANQPDLVVLDAEIVDGDEGLVADMKQLQPGCRVLMLVDAGAHSMVLKAARAGAEGFVAKESPLQDLLTAVRALKRGETVVPGHMLGPLLSSLMRQRKQEDAAFERILRLTQREKEVLALLAEGADNEAIAKALVISPQTARTHIQNILGKLNVHSRLEAAAIAMQNGLLENGALANGRRV
jgi:two-component system, NarL family, response regulator LiaR